MSRFSHLTALSPETHGGFNRGETPLRQFQIHRATAKYRGIEFKMTFDEWEKWWMDSGHYHERGLKRGQYVMARKGDQGAYELATSNASCPQTTLPRPTPVSRSPRNGKTRCALRRRAEIRNQ